MDFTPAFSQLVGNIKAIPQSGLLMAAFAAMLVGLVGTLAIRRVPALGQSLRTLSTVALMGVLLLVIVQLSRLDSRYELAVPQIGLPEQVVEGGETRVPLADDGHFWLRAEINGVPANFMVDTGATLTALSDRTAEAAGIAPRSAGVPVRMQTANGAVAAELATIDELRFGNVVARGLDVVIAPGLGRTNVIGMNLLNRLASVRFEQGTMVLVPHNPQPPVDAAETR